MVEANVTYARPARCSTGWYTRSAARDVLLRQVLSAVQTILLTLCSLRASRRLHDRLLRRLLYAPLAFFDGTSTGAVLNRCLSDLQNIDTNVPNSLTCLATQILQLMTQFGLVASS